MLTKTGGFGKRNEGLGRLEGIGQGLGHHHMLPRVEHVHGHGHMELIGRAHKDRIHLVTRTELSVIREEEVGPAGNLGRDFGHPLG